MENYKDQVVGLLKAGVEFQQLSDTILNELVGRLQIKDVAAGTHVIVEGEHERSMFVLVSGRLRVTRQGKDGNLMLYNEILPGEIVGELGVILDQPRTADIIALRSSVIGILSQEDFEQLLQNFPVDINRVFSQAIYNHLRHSRRIKRRKRAQAFIVIPLSNEVDAGMVAYNLTRAFSVQGKALHVALEGGSVEQNCNIDLMEAENEFLIYQAKASDPGLASAVVEYADQILFVAQSGAAKKLSRVEAELAAEPGVKLMRKHLIVLHPERTSCCEDKLAWQGPRDVERVYPASLDDLPDYCRIARFLVGKAVGVVLGGGGARGFAHLGALKAFEEKGIPVDLLGGNSMGALIGASYVFGIPIEKIHTTIRNSAKGLIRPDLPVVSIFSSKNFEKVLRAVFGDTQVQCLWTIYFSAACNLSRADTAVMDSGPLWQAVLASNSPAGLFPPVIRNGEMMVDGAILENVPVQAMRGRLGTALERRRGNGTIIALDVDVKEDLTVDPKIKSLKNWHVIRSRFDKKASPIPGLKRILSYANQMGGLVQRRRIMSLADHYLELPVSHFPMTAYSRAEEIIEIGYEHTLGKIQELQLNYS
ncbi:patatin-like phospholipase family protein [Desulfobacter curvatus]|uniref:patatin-like phospholipase family protein n=1 Tax=Desulfobacter curvatus TaxID=2290 RepID=UPI00036AA562|nr:cyclic nucleotide-binding and patatin-like phospholipase domain-containing protein [Desulfobacter curvatus]